MPHLLSLPGADIQNAVTMGWMGAEHENSIQLFLRQQPQKTNLGGIVWEGLHQQPAHLVDAGIGNVQIELLGKIELRQQEMTAPL